ncbi:hypothetical protein ERJ75_000809200 [Trypanosoma vivax]|nr:hypothetical protein ERJ75_000809200 [Trypanosoma vivax]
MCAGHRTWNVTGRKVSAARSQGGIAKGRFEADEERALACDWSGSRREARLRSGEAIMLRVTARSRRDLDTKRNERHDDQRGARDALDHGRTADTTDTERMSNPTHEADRSEPMAKAPKTKTEDSVCFESMAVEGTVR